MLGTPCKWSRTVSVLLCYRIFKSRESRTSHWVLSVPSRAFVRSPLGSRALEAGRISEAGEVASKTLGTE